MILSCNHINKAFGTDEILSEVSFHIEDQEKAAIVGINGAGKSTILKTISGGLAPMGGELVLDGVPTDRAINGMQQFILRHRDAICDPTVPDRRITFHGLRHTYAAEKYTSLVDGGMTPLDAHFSVSRLLGHERPDVTNIYLASVKGGTARGE